MFNAKNKYIMYYTSKIIQVAKVETIFGELIQWNYDRTNNVVVKEVNGQQRCSYPVEGIKDAHTLINRQLQTA